MEDDENKTPQPDNKAHEKAESEVIGHMEAYFNEVFKRMEGLTQMLKDLGDMHKSYNDIIDKSRKKLEDAEGDKKDENYRY